MIDYSIIIPVYNSEKSLNTLYIEIEKTFKTLDKSYEIIFVNDFSHILKTKTILKNLSDKPFLKIYHFKKNYGQQSATLFGLLKAKGKFLITMDDDLQHHPKEILKLIALQNNDVVIASFKKKKQNGFKNLGSLVFNFSEFLIIKKPFKIQSSGFRLIKSEVFNSIKLKEKTFPYINAMLYNQTSNIVNANVSHFGRMELQSGYSFLASIKLFYSLLKIGLKPAKYYNEFSFEVEKK